MPVINLPRSTGSAEDISAVEKIINEGKAEFSQLVSDIVNNRNQEAHEAESMIFRRLLKAGLLLMKLFFEIRGTGDCGAEIETAEGPARRSGISVRTYFSIFGRIKVSRRLYRTGGKTFAPADISLNLPERRYSYFLSEMLNHLNIKGAYSEGTGFIRKFFDLSVSVSASETVSAESASGYEEYYETGKAPGEPSEKKDFIAVSFDGKGVPMIKKEAAKIKGRPGKGEKRQKKKECLVGVRYEIDKNIRTVGDIAENLVYPENREGKEREKQNKACNIRYIAGIAKPKKEVMKEIYEEVKGKDFSDRPLLCLMDGAPYLWSYVKTVFRDISNKVYILDIIHVLEYIWIIAHIMYKEGSEDAKKYVYEKLNLILEGKVASYIMELQAELQSGRWKKKTDRDRFQKVITYFKNHRQYMKYDEYLSEGYPIGTGIVESACGHVVKDRMEISGARWGVEGAEPILRLRSVYKSEDLDDYWEFFISRARKNELVVL